MIDRTEIEKRDYIAAFDGLRAIAIMSIVGHQMMAYRIPGGFLGLNIFLLLSGYFMTASLMDSLMKNGKVPLKSFLTKRLKRIIVPTFAMIVAVIFYLLLFQRELLVNLRSTMVSNNGINSISIFSFMVYVISSSILFIMANFICIFKCDD